MFGHAEIQNFYIAGGREHDVFRLDIAVNDPLPMGRYQCFRALGSNGKEFLQRQRLPQALAKILPFDVFKNEEYLAMLLEHVVHGCHVSVTEARRPFSFFEEAVAIERVGAQRRG